MKINLPDTVENIVEIFIKSGYQIYLVGGAVRDALMGKEIYDWDFTTDATPDEILKILEKYDAYYTNNFGTVGVSYNEKERPLEITTFRTEFKYTDFRRPSVVKWGKSLNDDLKRRDFTINAMAIDLSKHQSLEIIDPFNGQEDINKKLIRAVGNANERFNEDALRMMRAVRIASELGFEIENETFEAIRSNAALINRIAKERVKDELIKLLKSNYPYEGIIILRNANLMLEILPELEKTFGIEQKSPGRHHIYDVGTHSLLSLKHITQKNTDPIVRLAALIHDIGKPITYKKDINGLITFYNHEIVSAKIASRIAERLKFSKHESQKLYTLVRYHQFTVNEDQTDSAIRRFIRKVGLENINDMLDLRVGDRLGGGASETSWRLEEFKKRIVEVQKQPFNITDLKVNGKDIIKILAIKPGPKVGEVLQGLFEKVEKQKLKNERKILLKEIENYKD